MAPRETPQGSPRTMDGSSSTKDSKRRCRIIDTGLTFVSILNDLIDDVVLA